MDFKGNPIRIANEIFFSHFGMNPFGISIWRKLYQDHEINVFWDFEGNIFGIPMEIFSEFLLGMRRIILWEFRRIFGKNFFLGFQMNVQRNFWGNAFRVSVNFVLGIPIWFRRKSFWYFGWNPIGFSKEIMKEILSRFRRNPIGISEEIVSRFRSKFYQDFGDNPFGFFEKIRRSKESYQDFEEYSFRISNDVLSGFLRKSYTNIGGNSIRITKDTRRLLYQEFGNNFIGVLEENQPGLWRESNRDFKEDPVGI